MFSLNSLFKNKKNIRNRNSNHNVDMTNIPKHIAIIMDGNGRWAKERGLPRSMGHKSAVEAIRPVVKKCSNLGVKYLTLYAFSTENWKRPKDEVNTLMKLLAEYLRSEFEELNANNVVINSIGDITKLPKVCQDELNFAYEKTKDNTGLVLNLALNYGGREELIHCFNMMYKDIQDNRLICKTIDEKTIQKYLYTSGMPDPDLIIRTSGEERLSNFLLWQCAYSELWFSDIKWPDFKEENLLEAISDYQKRNRRFGGI